MTSTIAIAVSTTIAAIEGRVGRHGVDVPVEPVVAHELRERAGLGEHRVDEFGGSVAVRRQQVAQDGPQRTQRRELRLVSVAPARVAVLGVPGVELRDGRERVGLFSGVDQVDRRPQRRDRVMGKQHVDSLRDAPIVIGHGDDGQ